MNKTGFVLAAGLMGFLSSNAHALGSLPKQHVDYTATNASTETLKGFIDVFTKNCPANPYDDSSKQSFDLDPSGGAKGIVQVPQCPGGSYLVGAEASLASNSSSGAGCHLALSTVNGGFPTGTLHVSFVSQPATPTQHPLKCVITLQ